MSRILILGGNGQTGLHAINEALDRGHTVTALVRNPDTMEIRRGFTVNALVKNPDTIEVRPGLTVVKGTYSHFLPTLI